VKSGAATEAVPDGRPAGEGGDGAAGPVTVELAFAEPEAAARLVRQAAWRRAAAAATGAAAGRRRPVAVALAWHDTASGALARCGLALEVPQRGPRLLLRSLPGPEMAWRPGTPPEPVAVLDDPDAPLPDAAGLDGAERKMPLRPLAAFEGRRARFALMSAEDAPDAPPILAELLTGRLRAVGGERAVARLTLAGPCAPVLALARALAAELPVLPPRAALAEEARALALDEPVRPRRAGPPVLAGAADARRALGLALGHLAEALLYHAPLARPEAGPEGVHQMRVALRRMRSVLRLFRPVATADEAPVLRAFEARLRDLAGTLGPARDWDVFLGGLGAELAAALPQEPRLAELLRAAEMRRAEAYATLRRALDGPEFRVLACDAMALAMRFLAAAEAGAAPPDGTAPPPPEPLGRFAAAALDRRWRRLRARGEAMSVSLDDEALHALRLEGKRMRYAAELFAPLWPGKPSRRFVRRLAVLQEALGLANDAATARRLVAELGSPAPPSRRGADHGRRADRGERRRAWAIGLAEGFAMARARRVRKRALRAWEALLRRAPFWQRG
jgi:CHAD domain-containing protein